MQEMINETIATLLQGEENHFQDGSGWPIFRNFILGIADAQDPIFAEFASNKSIHGDNLLPGAFLPEARRVVVYFLSYSDEVVDSNKAGGAPSFGWLYGRIEGEAFNCLVRDQLAAMLREAGYQAVVPALTPRYNVLPNYLSTWSERHAAYAAGLGSFGLSRSFITPLGSAGRLASVITDCPLPITATHRPAPFAHCLHFSRGICGACIKRCPAEAITSSGMVKTHCSELLDRVLAENSPRYGCGKCQTKVPCSRGIPLG